MKLFQYAIILHDKDNKAMSKILVPLTTVLAADLQQAQIMAARAIPENALDSLDKIEVAIRPF